MAHPLYAYLEKPRDGHVPDDRAREDITGMVNDPDLIRDVCALFHEKANMDATCYAMGKVYDVNGDSFGCVSIISEDVAGIIGEPTQGVQEGINYALVSAFIEFQGMFEGRTEIVDAWDEYLNLVLVRNFLPLYENGMRAMLVHNSRITGNRLPMVVFAVYLQYDAL